LAEMTLVETLLVAEMKELGLEIPLELVEKLD
jgi:hypothetical protein